MKIFYYTLIVLTLVCVPSCEDSENYLSITDYGAITNSRENTSVAMKRLIEELQSRQDSSHVLITFPKGTYHFFEDSAFVREYYISNHDQTNPKKVGIAIENLRNVTIDGNGSEFVFHGRMIPISLLNSENITLKNFSIDFEIPALRQLNILDVNVGNNELLAEIYPSGNYHIENGRLIIVGESFEIVPETAMSFREDKRLTYLRRDVYFNPEVVSEKSPNVLSIKGWYQINETTPGERFVLRSYYRPTPGIFISECLDTYIENVTVHYAEGMGLLAQMSENITLNGFNVSLKGENDLRYFTTQADATHFSACKGVIMSKNGLYEGMADDAINVHGTYLKLMHIVDDYTLHASYMHNQTWGFKWGEQGDSIQFIESEKMELIDGEINIIQSINSVDSPTEFGAKVFEIKLNRKIPSQVQEGGTFGIENVSWTPEVIFSNNIIRNNRARGSLFSTPKRVVCEGNLFDHTHGTAILLCGDSNGWYETGACRDVIIRNNRFVNALTANYQFTNAVISIYPEIPNLIDQKKFFHSGIVIENNIFEMFDQPILYAKSTDGLIFRDNTVLYNNDFEPFHWNKHKFYFEKVDNIIIENNQFENGFDTDKDLRVELSDNSNILIM